MQTPNRFESPPWGAVILTLVILGIFGTLALWLGMPSLTLREAAATPLASRISDLDLRTASLLIFAGLLVLAAAFAAFFAMAYHRLNLGPIVEKLVRSRVFTVEVGVDQKIPITFTDEILVPIDMTFKVDFDQELHIETEIPVDLNLPIDTVIETNVLGLGKLNIPIKGLIPIRMNFPFAAPVRVRSDSVSIHVNQTVPVRVPEVLVPVRARIVAEVPLSRTPVK